MSYSVKKESVTGSKDFEGYLGQYDADRHTVTCTGDSADVYYSQYDSDFILAQNVTNGSININAYGVGSIRIVSSGTTSVTMGGK